jgi:chromosome segregation ATPase
LLLDEAAVGNADYADFCAPYRDQADALLTKVLSLEERVAGLEERDGGNVFTWIGKNAQGLVLRSFLTKAQENLDQLRQTVGERYSRRDVAALPDSENNNAGEIENLCAEIERKRAEVRVLSQELAELREERRTISVSYNSEGGPIRQIQTLKNHITHVRDELKALYRRIGAEMAAVDGIERRQIIDSLIAPEDRDDLDNAARISRSIHDNETMIAKLQASLDIDEEKARIEKYRGMIGEKREKIAQAEKSIMEYEENIRVSEAGIEKLKALL